MHICPVVQYLLYVVPRQFRKRPAERERKREREQHAKVIAGKVI